MRLPEEGSRREGGIEAKPFGLRESGQEARNVRMASTLRLRKSGFS